MASVFVATAGPPGWKLGRWSQISTAIWQEQKLDNSKSVYQFQVVGGTNVAGSSTIRLKMKDQNTEVLLLESTIQVFSNAGYLGEYVGQWQSPSSSPPAPGRRSSPAAAAPVVAAPAREVPQDTSRMASKASAGYKPDFSAPPARGATQVSEKTPLDVTLKPSKSLPRIGASVVSSSPVKSSANSRPQKPQGLDKSPDKIQKLFDAAKNGDTQGVQRLLESGVDPDGPTRDGRTPLMAAAGGGHLAVVETLLAAFADPNLAKGSETPLSIAFNKGNQDILKVLFAASMTSCESMIGSRCQLMSRPGTAMEPDIEVPQSATENLRHVTRNLVAFNTRDQPSPQGRRGFVPEKMHVLPERTMESDSSDVMREDAVRLTMRSLARDTKKPKGLLI